MNLALAIPAAIGLGALHSLEPGHGKGIISAYLVATHGKTKDALLIGVISAVTHSLSIVMLSFVATGALKRLAPEHSIHWIEFTVGLLITLIGVKMFYQLARPRIVSLGKLSHQHTETCEHHHYGHHHQLHHGTPTSFSRLIAVGFLAGLIPCPSAMAIFLAAVTADQIPFGIGLVAAFSLGSAITMSMIGILIVRAGAALKQLEKISFVRSLGFVSSFLIVSLGILVTLQSMEQL
jgi:ABC-type nickel/cobalt efflux system permease component RcnA